MILGACRALEICTFAKKECIGANEPGSEGESSVKTREVVRDSHARCNTLLTSDCGKSNLLCLVVVSSLPILLGQFCPYPNLAFALVQHENEIGRVFLEFVKFDRHDFVEEIKFNGLRGLLSRHCPARMLLTLGKCDRPTILCVWDGGRQVVARKRRVKVIGLDEAPKHTAYRTGTKLVVTLENIQLQGQHYRIRKHDEYWCTQSIDGPWSVFMACHFQEA